MLMMPTNLVPGAVFGAGARDHQFGYGVASLSPSGDGAGENPLRYGILYVLALTVSVYVGV